MSLVGLVRRFPLVCYFALAYALSGVALLVIGMPKLSGPAGRPTASFTMFPMMVVGVGVIGIALTAATEGASGIRELRSRLTLPVKPRWWLALALPPIAIAGVLVGLQTVASGEIRAGIPGLRVRRRGVCRFL